MVECEGRVISAMVRGGGEGANYYLEWEFHVPASSCTTRPGQTNSEFGVKVTGRRRVGQAIHEAHATGLPKPCTVSYAPADPRYHRLIKVGDDDIPFMLPHNSPQLCPSGVRGYIVSFVLLCGSLIGVIALMDAVEPISFCVVFGIVAVISAPFVPCGMMVPCCDSIYTVTKLKAPYQRPQYWPAQPQPQPHASG